MNGLLTGYTVLEMANVISGPYAGMLLADLGADVTKVELPSKGDVFRVWVQGDDISAPFAAYNRNKKSVTIDVRNEDGAACYLKLASSADIIIENFRPHTLDRWGVGYSAVRAINPDVIYCSISGMGESGPEYDRPTYDAIAQAKSGLWSQLTDMSNPEPVGPPISDQLSGLYAAYGILAALVRRGNTGVGERIRVSMVGASVAFQAASVAGYLLTGEVDDYLARAKRSQSYAFKDSHGHAFAVHISTPHKFWKGLVQAAQRPELLTDPRFRTKPDRMANYHALHEELSRTFVTRSRDKWLSQLHEHGVPASPINNVKEALDDPQVNSLNMVQTFGKGERSIPLVGFPVQFEQHPCVTNLPPPKIGEHTDEILEETGLSPADLRRLKDDGTI